MATRANRRRKAPITAHPVFPGVVALWFAVLLGVGSLLLPAALFEALVRVTHIDSVVSAAAPPLGGTARALIALGMAALGALLGVAIARRIATASAVPAPEIDGALASELLGDFVSTDLQQPDEEESPLLFSGFDEEDDDAPPVHGHADEAPVFTVPEDLAADPIRDLAPADFNEAEVALGEPELPASSSPPAAVNYDAASEQEDFASELVADRESGPAYVIEGEVAPEPQADPIGLARDHGSRSAPEAPLHGEHAAEQDPPSIAELAARLQSAMKRHRDLRAPALPVAEIPFAETTALDTPSTFEAAHSPTAFVADPVFEEPADEGIEQAPENYRDEFAAPEYGHDWPAEPEHPEGYDLVATKGKAGIPRPFFDLDFASAQDDDEDTWGEEDDVASSFELPIPREDGPRVTFAGLADDLLDDPPIEAGEEDEEDEGSSFYGSLLGMKGPYSSGAKDASGAEHSFAHQEFDNGFAAEENFGRDEYGEEDGQHAGAFEPETQDQPAPHSLAQAVPPRAASLSREEQDKALREALLNLQRISGAA